MMSPTETSNRLEKVSSYTLPSQSEEDWKYINLKKLDPSFYQISSDSVDEEWVNEKIQSRLKDSYHIVLINGLYRKDLSFINTKELSIKPVDKINLEPKFSANDKGIEPLNFSICSQVLMIDINKSLSKPLQILCLADSKNPINVANRWCISAQANTQSTLYIDFNINSAETLENTVQNITLAEHSQMEIINKKSSANTSYRFDTTTVSLAEKACFKARYFSSGGAILRNETNIIFNGSDAESDLGSLGLGNEISQLFHKTNITIHAENCISRQNFKNILTGRSQSEYNGLVYVHQKAQETDSDQINRNLILSDHAKAFSRPQLRIYADKVACTHGSTSGALEDQEILYLMSRGIDPETAQSILIYGFSEEIILLIESASIQEVIEQWLKPLLRYFTP